MATRRVKVGAGDHGQFVGDRRHVPVGSERSLLEQRHVLVRDARPIRIRRARPLVGEDEPGETRRRAVEQPDRLGQPQVAVGPTDELGQPVDQDGRCRVEAVQQRPYGRPDHPAGPRVRTTTREAGVRALAEAIQMHPLVRGQPERVGERGEHLCGRPVMTALLEPDQVLHADAGERRHLGPAQAGSAAARAGGQPGRGRRGGLPAGAQEHPELVVAHRPNLTPPDAPDRGPAATTLGAASPFAGACGTVAGMRHDVWFGLSLDDVTGDALLARAGRADDDGLDLVTLADHPWIGDRPDAYAALGVILGRTTRIAGAVNVTNLPNRPAPMLSRTVAALSALAGGRIVLGMGAGGSYPEIARFGLDVQSPARAVRALAEAITLIRALGGGGAPVTFAGEFYSVRELAPTPEPVPPIWTGSVGPASLAVTGRLADGWIPGHAADWRSARVAASRPVIDEAAASAGRDPRSIATVYNLPGRITRDAAAGHPRRERALDRRIRPAVGGRAGDGGPRVRCRGFRVLSRRRRVDRSLVPGGRAAGARGRRSGLIGGQAVAAAATRLHRIGGQDRGEERLRVRVRRSLVHLGGAAQLHYGALVQYRRPGRRPGGARPGRARRTPG